MYSSLHKVDIGIEVDGARVAVQTDHRERAEIEQELELSAVFALTRVINPIRAGSFDRTRYSFLREPPDEIVELLSLAGAEIETLIDGTTQETRPARAPEDEAVDQRAAMALRALGARIYNERGLPLSEQGLMELQTEYAARAAASGGVDEDEITWWSAVVELGAAVGELICTVHGGQWVRDPEFASLVPFMVAKDSALTNVFSKVERFFKHGESESPLNLLRILQDQQMEDGPVMFNLRPGDWHGREHTWGRAILPSSEDEATQPFVTLVHDLPNTTRTLARLSQEEAARLTHQAERNLAELATDLDEVDANGVRILITHGDYYASEKLLDRRYMNGLHERLAAGLLVASVPAKGMLFTAALTDPDVVNLFVAITHGQFERAPHNEKLSPDVFVVSGGDVVGVARPAAEGEA